MMTDIEIAQSIKPRKITEIAKVAGISEDDIEFYGNHKRFLLPLRSIVFYLMIVDEINKIIFMDAYVSICAIFIMFKAFS